MYHRNHSTDKNSKPAVTVDTTKIAHVVRKEGKWAVMNGQEEIAVMASVTEAMEAMRNFNRTQEAK